MSSLFAFDINVEDRRNTRNILLSQCDWTQMPDSPLNDTQKTSWALYRQALRDITSHVNFPYLAEGDWPVEP